MKRIGLIIFIGCLLMLSAAAADIAWTVSGGVLTITGTGDMPNYNYEYESGRYGGVDCDIPWWTESYSSVVVGEGITSIGAYAFYSTPATRVTLPSTLKKIGTSAFENASGINSIDLPEGLTDISASAFYRSGLSQVTIPSTVQTIGQDAFLGIMLVYPESVPQGTTGNLTWVYLNGTLKLLGEGPMPDYTISQTYYRGTVIDTTCDTPWYQYRSNITKVELSNAITSIGNYAFINLSNLKAISNGTGIASIGAHAFEHCSSLTQYIIPNGVQSVGVSAFERCFALKTVSIPNSVTTIGASAFAYCYALTGVVIPGSITRIAENTFSNCTALTTVSIPGSVTSIGSEAFSFCSAIASVYYSAQDARSWVAIQFETISSNPMAESGLAHLYINSQENEFTGYSSLKTDINDYAFYNCQNRSITINVNGGENVKIGDYAFYNFKGYLSIGFPTSSGYVGSYAFYGCSGLSDIYNLDDRISYIGDYAFCGCTSLKSFNMTKSGSTTLTYFGDGAFSGCSSLSLFVMGPVSYIPRSCFNNCTSLQSIRIPATVTTLGTNAFYGCNSLNELIFDGKGPDGISGSSNVFYGVTATVTYKPDSTWNGKIGNYGGNLTWKPLGGSCGDSAVWTLSGNGLLRIAGTGTVSASTWTAYDNEITQILIETGITEISSGTFSGLSKVTEVAFADIPAVIGENAFSGISAEVYWPEGQTVQDQELYGGDLQWIHPVCGISSGNAVYVITAYDHTLAIHSAGNPTCTQTGNIEYWECEACSVCFKDADATTVISIEDTIVAALGHEYSVEYEWEGAACTAHFTCLREDDVQHKAMTVVGEIVKNPGCTDNGETKYTAEVEFGEKKEVDPDTGEEVMVPVLYQDVKILADIPANGHQRVITPGTPATCTEKGLSDEVSCKVCGVIIEDAHEIEALGHADVITKEGKAATCTESGLSDEHSCSRCGVLLQSAITIPALGHQYQPVFSWNGDECSVTLSCVREDDVVMLDCTVASETTKQPDCTQMGIRTLTASLQYEDVEYSNQIEREDIPANGHQVIKDAAVLSTDRDTGLTEGSHCGVCGIVFTAQEVIPALWNYSDDGLTVESYNGNDVHLTIPKGVTTLGKNLFTDNGTVKSVIVPDEVTAIGSQSFSGASALEDIWLPDQLSGITSQTFANTNARIHASTGSATAVLLSLRAIPFWDSQYELLYRVSNGVPASVIIVYDTEDQEEIHIPEMIGSVPVKEIRSKAYENHEMIRRVFIPESVTTIATDAFSGCSSEMTVYSEEDAYAKVWAQNAGIQWKAIAVYVLQTPDFILPSALTTIESEAFAQTSAKVIWVPGQVTTIGARAFANSEYLSQIYIPAGTTSIDNTAFENCTEDLVIFGAKESEAERIAGLCGFVFVVEEQ